MKYKVVLLFALTLISFTSFAQSANKESRETAYIFGLGASFKDSLAYITPIQTLDSVVVNKEKTLVGLSYYSDQLKRYLETSKGANHETCIIFTFKSKKKAQKKFTKIYHKFKMDNSVLLNELSPSDFVFKRVKLVSGAPAGGQDKSVSK